MAKRCLSCGRVSYALAVRREPSDIAAARVIDSRGVAGCRLAADDLAARIVGRRHVSVRRRATSRSAAAIAERRGVAVRRCAADTLATAVIVRGRVSVRDPRWVVRPTLSRNVVVLPLVVARPMLWPMLL